MHYSDPTECQDGVTNNCTQICNRTVSNGTSFYECGCDKGFQLNSDSTTCDGKSMCNEIATTHLNSLLGYFCPILILHTID